MSLIIILTILILVINIYFSLHAIKTDNKKWIVLIFIFPIAGFLMYFIYEYRHNKYIKQHVDRLATKFRHSKTEKLHSILLPICYSFFLALGNLFTYDKDEEQILLEAKKLLDKGNYNPALRLFQKCYQENSKKIEVLKGLSICYFYRNNFFYKNKSDFIKVKKYLIEYTDKENKYYDKDAMLLLARTFENLDDFEEAQKIYISLLDYQTFIEAKCRYALLLMKKGDNDTALELFINIIECKKHCSAETLFENKKWLTVAKNNLNHFGKKPETKVVSLSQFIAKKN